MRLVFSIGWFSWAAAHWFDGLVEAVDDEDEAVSLIQASVTYSKMRSGAGQDQPMTLDAVKACLAELAVKREVLTQDVKISDSELRSLVEKVKACAGEFGMEEDEYMHFMTYVRDHAPQRLLIWGLGADSLVLNLLNYGGETLFLEPDQEWIDIMKQTYAGQSLHVAHFEEKAFNTTVDTYHEFLLDPYRADNVGPLEAQLCWDTVLVDSPIGSESDPTKYVGRAVPMYTALADIDRCKREGKYTADAEVSVFVHDCTRPLEDEVSSTLFTAERLQHEVGPKKLRQYCMTCSSDDPSSFKPPHASR
jgi:hypothetical protein